MGGKYPHQWVSLTDARVFGEGDFNEVLKNNNLLNFDGSLLFEDRGC